MLKLICDQNDPERAFVKFDKDDDSVLLINNYGGLSNLELGALAQETLAQLGISRSENKKRKFAYGLQKQNGISNQQRYTQGPSRLH